MILGVWVFKKYNFNLKYEIGQKIDDLDGVSVYYNGGVNNVTERNRSDDGYNLGLKYQCVEFVKRYYYEHYHHKMPDSYGHGKDFFDDLLKDNTLNKKRNLIQYKNPSRFKPEKGDLIVLKGTLFNRFGHVAIISKVEEDQIEIIQQNPGPFGSSRENIPLIENKGAWKIKKGRVLGFLRKGE